MHEEITGGYNGHRCLTSRSVHGFRETRRGPAVAERMSDSTIRMSILAREKLRIVEAREQV